MGNSCCLAKQETETKTTIVEEQTSLVPKPQSAKLDSTVEEQTPVVTKPQSPKVDSTESQSTNNEQIPSNITTTQQNNIIPTIETEWILTNSHEKMLLNCLTSNFPMTVISIIKLYLPIALQLKSKEGKIYKISQIVAMQSALIKTIWSGDIKDTLIELPEIRSVILEKVILFLEYSYKHPMPKIEKPLKSADMKMSVPEWFADFVDTDQETLFELILGATYLDFQPLIDLTCAKVASMMKGKSPEEIRKQFNIVNDFTPEEEEAVRAENKWAEDS